jgi:hypothetical protein
MPRGPKGEKRPADVIGNAVHVMRVATGELKEPTSDKRTVRSEAGKKGGKPLFTLRDTANYITKLPKAQHQAPEWQTAVKVLMLIGEHGGDPRMR